MAKKDIVVTFAPYSQKDLERAKEIFNGHIVRKVVEYITENYPEEQQNYILDEYIKFFKNNIEQQKIS